MLMMFVTTACPCCMSMVHVPVAYANCMSLLHVYAACPCCKSVLHVHAACLCCMSMLHVHATCSGCMPVLYGPAAWPPCMSMLQVVAARPIFKAACPSCIHAASLCCLATFTKSGCSACRNEQGRVNHTGRDGTPVVLVIGDESVPSVVGHTDEGEREAMCAWVLKKEHLAFKEVAGILERVNKQKREADKKRGKRMQKFFVPNGSKVLVSSYCMCT
jgi:hypothetical protein